MAGTTGAARQPRTDINEKEAAQAPSVPHNMPTGREERRKLPDLPFECKYGGGEDYYVRDGYKEYYPLVEQFVLTEESCLTVTGTPDIGKSVFYAYFFEEFWKAHRDEWIVVAVSYKAGAATQFAVYEDGVETTRVTCADEEMLLTFLRGLQHQLDKLAEDQDCKSEEAKKTIRKILLLCDGTPKTRRSNMVVFTGPNDEWFRINETDEDLLFMPLWTSDELQEAALVLELGLDDDEIDRRVHVFGGTARFCLSRDASEVTLAKERLLALISREITDGARLQDLLFENDEVQEDTRNSLLHLEPLADEKRYGTIKLASSFVRTKLEQYLQMLEFTAREQLRESLGKKTKSAAGWIFEVNSHETLRLGCEFRVTSLPEGDIAPVEESTLLIAKSKRTDEFDADTLSPSLVTSGPYHKPTAKTWESIYLPKMSSDKPVPDRTAAKWREANDGPLILFQMTILKSHPVSASELVYVLSKLEFLERLEHVKLVFVVPNELVDKFKRQPIVLVTAVGTDSVREIRGIGRATSALLSEFDIRTIADLETEVNLRGNVKKQKTTASTKAPTLKDTDPERWDQIVKLWEQHELTVKYGEKVAAIAQYVGSWTAS